MLYNIIYADPPWSYKVWSAKGSGRSAEQHYKTMVKEDIQSLHISSIAASDCVLFLWATYPCLEEALELVKAWGFTYKTVAFTWVKRNKISDSWFWGLGHWTRSNPEICILATKGNPHRVSKGVHSVVDDRIGRHSEKPDTVRKRIVELCGDLPRIELFARQKFDGWDVFGNEVEGSIELTKKENI
jgi:N6-adenosine-specific RNA methylase IME4